MGSNTPQNHQPPYPLHESVKNRLHPDYVAFYNEHVIHQQQVHLQPVSASRKSGILIPGGGPIIPVGKTEDFLIKRQITQGPDVPVRTFKPEGDTPAAGWPVMVYYHGGGWVLGNIDTENTVCTNLCSRANCVVLSIEYRLAPEDPYPAAVQDSHEALFWLASVGASLLSLDLARVCVGGSSAGGNLAAVMSQKLQSSPIPQLPPILAQLLNVPVMDNTASIQNKVSWKENEFSPALPAAKMMWYRHHYLPDRAFWDEAEASPLLWEGDWKSLPEALVIIGELDVLRSEGEEFAAKLVQAGVRVDLRIMKGMPHPFLAMDRALQQGRDTITSMVEILKRVFHE